MTCGIETIPRRTDNDSVDEMGCGNSRPATSAGPVLDPQTINALDQHARQAPEASSVDEIYLYLSTASTNHVTMVRLIYVWITEFIGHSSADVQANDVEQILQTKVAGNTGYVKLFEALCKRADIPVQNLEGFAKGVNHSPDTPYTLTTLPNHAWNAVQCTGQWYLIDCTWGAGHIQRDGHYKRDFDDFYFMTDPKQLVVTHFPLINGDLAASKRWQLLNKPISLDEFNKRLTPYPEAFKYKVDPVSHTDAILDVKGDVKIVFKIREDHSMIFMSSLWFIEDNKLVEQSNHTFDTIYENEYSIQVRPCRTGTFHLRVFGGRNEEVGKEVDNLPLLFRYIIKCTSVIDENFEFPEVAEKALTNKCMLLGPLNGKLVRDSVVNVHVKSAHLNELMINGNAIKGENGEFKGSVDLQSVEESTMTIYGSKENSDKYMPLYGYEVVNKELSSIQ